MESATYQSGLGNSSATHIVGAALQQYDTKYQYTRYTRIRGEHDRWKHEDMYARIHVFRLLHTAHDHRRTDRSYVISWYDTSHVSCMSCVSCEEKKNGLASGEEARITPLRKCLPGIPLYIKTFHSIV